ncbi:MAG: hypothetical protein H7062_17230 [Candidatus Saccharimonas sp.]|nr:hypothetical protein [Planctomycetaceae bacterium]
MRSVETGLSVKSLVEVALLASRVGRCAIEDRCEPSSNSLRDFWQQTRELQKHWTSRLDAWSAETDPELSQLAELSIQLFTSELLTRVWSTVLLGIDQQTGRDDLSRIARNAVSGLLQVRHGVMSRLLQQPDSLSKHVAEIERMRRRCDRWADLLIGNLAGSRELFEFAFEVERARDFATESMDYDPSTGPHPVEHLVAAGLRMAFLGQLPETPLTEPAFLRLVQSILGALPQEAFHRDGPLRSVLERRVSSRMLRDEPLPASMLDALASESAPSTTESFDTIPFPGISFSKLRRRPK